MSEYRIVRDNYAGYEVQVRRWWWPFWQQCGFCNTHCSIERAEQYAIRHSRPVVKMLGKVKQEQHQ